MDQIIHFSHPEHPLILINEAHKNESCDEVVCYGCQIPINNFPAYECATCNLFLHKRCAEAPTEIIHPMHYEHPLTLHSHPPYPEYDSTCSCNVCSYGNWKWFTYNCSKCEFDIDIICALKDKDDRRFKHKSHQHPLTFQLRPALFHCDACGTKNEDFSYICTTCPFWIHKTCAELPSTIKLGHHKHTLELAYSLPDMHRVFEYNCDFCHTLVHPVYWLYYCGNCRYFIHVQCAITSSATPQPLLQSDDEDHQNLDLFPIPNRSSADVMSQFLKKMSLGDANCNGEEELKIDHWSHDDHPLILWDDQNTNIVYDGMFCAACMQPITAPFYHCIQCSYFLHRYCALLPLELQHPAHPDHTLKINSRNDIFYFACKCCGKASSGFCYSCRTCNVNIDIGCASLPTKILHESHQHPLVSHASDCLCDACNMLCSGFAYKCETENCSYNLMYGCATMLQHTLTHDYDDHPISLTYPPVEDHPSEFYCEICEEEIHPKFWLYYCHHCSFSFHIDCILPSVDWYSNVKFGDTYEFDDHIHQHPLTLVRNGGKKSPCLCAKCGKDMKGHPVLECSECGFKICLECSI